MTQASIDRKAVRRGTTFSRANVTAAVMRRSPERLAFAPRAAISASSASSRVRLAPLVKALTGFGGCQSLRRTK
jgi:hypothetical protein